MKKSKVIIIIFVILLVGGLVFYKGAVNIKLAKNDTAMAKDSKEVLFWTCGMHPQVKQDKPGKCPICNMDLVPVYKEEQKEANAQVPQSQNTSGEYYGCGIKEEGHCPHCDKGIKDAQCICGEHSFTTKDKNLNVCPVCKNKLVEIAPQDLPKKEIKTGEKKILFYRNPMNPAITSEVPMKDQMGMDFVPVYEESQESMVSSDSISRLHLSQNQLQLAGVKSEPVSKKRLFKQIRTVGKIAFDPELAVAQEEFLTAIETKEKVSHSTDSDVLARAQDMVDKSKFRLRLLGMSEDEITQLEKEKTAQLNLVLPDNTVWVYADIYEYDLFWVKVGQATKITTTAYPQDVFGGKIKSISPVINAMTRTATVRLEVDNSDRKLMPEMYVDVVIESVYKDFEDNEEVLAIPRDAILDTGLRKIVYVDTGEGNFIGKEVKVGSQATAIVNDREEYFYPVLSGLKEGDMVVTKGNFLIDSQSQISGVASGAYGGALGEKEETKAPVHQH